MGGMKYFTEKLDLQDV